MQSDYEEKLPVAGPIIYGPALVAVAVAAITSVLAGMEPVRDPVPRWLMLAALIPVALIMALVGWVVGRMLIRVRGGVLVVGLPVAPAKIDVGRIEWIAREEITRRGCIETRRALKGRQRHWGFRPGAGVRVHTSDPDWDYVFPTGDPESLARALGKELLPEAPGE